MKTYSALYSEIISLKNLILAWKKARKGKTNRNYVRKFEKDIAYNLKILYDELNTKTYKPMPLKSFILRDPKTRIISKSEFRDRIVHHALVKVVEPIFDKTFIYDSCANRIGKGTSFALKRFEKFQRKATHNFSKEAFCLKADIRHYFQEIDKEILQEIIKEKIQCKDTLSLIKLILDNFELDKGMPLGNLTSQFFANVYLSKLDYFVKHTLKARHYIRYVDDFVILHKSKEQLELWKKDIDFFLREKLKLELHPEKTKIISLSKGVDFVGFRNFYYFKILRKRSMKNMLKNMGLFKAEIISKEKLSEIFKGWQAHAKQGNCHDMLSRIKNSHRIL